MEMTAAIRTDLALESQESVQGTGNAIPGVKIRKKSVSLGHVQTTIVKIISREGEKRLGKPKGTYITMEIPDPIRQTESCITKSPRNCVGIFCGC